MPGRGDPPPGRRFQKGEVANPEGGRAIRPELRRIRRLTQREVEAIGSLLLDSNLDGLMELKNNPKTSALKLMIAAVAIRTIAKGDAIALNALLDRIVGKVKQKVEVTGDEGAPLFSEDQVHEMAKAVLSAGETP